MLAPNPGLRVLADAEGRAPGASLQSLQVPSGSRLLQQGAMSAGACYLVRQGILRLERVTASGERRIVGLLGRRSYVGVETLPGQPHTDDVVACTAARLHRVPGVHAWPLIFGRSACRHAVTLCWQQQLLDSRDWMAELNSGPARRRMLMLLRRLSRLSTSRSQPRVIWLPKRAEIAAMLGITVETASRQVSALRREGLIGLADAGSATLDTSQLAEALARAC